MSEGKELKSQLSSMPINQFLIWIRLSPKACEGLEHSIYITRVSPHHQLSAYSNWFKLVQTGLWAALAEQHSKVRKSEQKLKGT